MHPIFATSNFKFSWWKTLWLIYTHLGMDQYLLIPFLVGWTSINPSYFDIHQGYYWFWHTAIWLRPNSHPRLQPIFLREWRWRHRQRRVDAGSAPFESKESQCQHSSSTASQGNQATWRPDLGHPKIWLKGSLEKNSSLNLLENMFFDVA